MGKYNIGDPFTLAGSGCFERGVKCIVVAVSENGRYATKLKAVVPDERLGRMGFIEEDGEYYAQEWQWSRN
jgi:alpha-galactosidase